MTDGLAPASPVRSPGSELRRPSELDDLDLGRSGVIEASAGTGKTYLLEHLVLELLISGRARLEEILVVTFTERATAELVTRIRQKIDLALATAPGDVTSGWSLDAAARARLIEARQSFDQATIATIHAFCQRVLTDEPLATSRLLGQTQVDARACFRDAFRDVLRRTLSTTDGHPAYLQAYLGSRRSVDDLEQLLFATSVTRGDWAAAFDENAWRGLVERLARLNLESPPFRLALKQSPIHHSRARALIKRLEWLIPVAAMARQTGDWARVLADFDAQFKDFVGFEAVAALTHIPDALAPLHEIAVQALNIGLPFDEVIAQRFVPLVQARLRARKLAEGLYDFDDMIAAVDEAISGEWGPAVIGRLRRRFRFALIDEAQDTEPAQWRIFRRTFLDSHGPHPVFLIGDPKQAIYGFRGADVHTYVQAREDIRARGGGVVSLQRNFRSHPEVVSAYNAILSHHASPRYFTGDSTAYDHPVTAAKPPLGNGPGVTLFSATFPPEYGKAARIGTIKLALQNAISREIQALRANAEPANLSRIHVLTRSNLEAREISACLHRAGVANLLFKPDDIFDSVEATHVRTLLLGIADPTDRGARLAAWLTPFFGASLDELAQVGEPEPPPDHPLMARLTTWKALADERAYDALWARILDDSGIARRLRLSAAELRRLTNYRHLFDILHEQASSRPVSLTDLAALLAAFAAGYRRGVNDSNTQRLETESEAVRIMTIHAAKGLEADIVFLYGALVQPRVWRGTLSVFHHESQRLRCVGKPKRADIFDRVESARREEGQRLMYVALTRARKHLYLPFFPETDPGDSDSERTSDYDPFTRITGEYRYVNQRLRALVSETDHHLLFNLRTLETPPTDTRDPHTVLADITAWTPPAIVCPPRGQPGEGPRAGDLMTALRTRRRGFAITSYSRLSDSEGGYRHAGPPAPATTYPNDSLEIADARAAAILDPLERLAGEPSSGRGDTAPRDALPGGIASGLFLHAILEKATLGELPVLPTWQEQPDVRQLIESESRRWDREPRHFVETARLVHATLTVPIRMPDGEILPGMARASRLRREVDFLFPLPPAMAAHQESAIDSPEDRLVHERGFVRGALDVLFEHNGRICFADWKSNVLPGYSVDAIEAHVNLNYALQVQIYTLALVRMLGIRDREGYERGFGGLVYLFMRGLNHDLNDGLTAPSAAGADGLFVHRPDYTDVERWNVELGNRHVAGAGGGW